MRVGVKKSLAMVMSSSKILHSAGRRWNADAFSSYDARTGKSRSEGVRTGARG
jgi:hypothetical protein